MGIMNKMKTVAINQMTWGYWEPTKKFYANLVGPEAVPNTLNLACDGYTPQRGGTSGTSLIDHGIAIHNNGTSIYIRNDSYNGDTVAFKAAEGDKTITYETIDSVEEKIAHVEKLPFNSATFSMYRNPTSTGTVSMTNNLISIKKDTSDGQIGVINKNIGTKGFFAVRARKLNDKRTILRIFRYDGYTSIGWSTLIYELTNDWNLYIFNDTPINRAEIQTFGSAAGSECEISDIFIIPQTLNTEEII